MVERLTEQGMRLLTRVRKLVPKKDDTGGNTAKAYIKVLTNHHRQDARVRTLLTAP